MWNRNDLLRFQFRIRTQTIFSTVFQQQKKVKHIAFSIYSTERSSRKLVSPFWFLTFFNLFYVGSGSKSGFGTVIHSCSCPAKAKSYGSCGPGSTTLLQSGFGTGAGTAIRSGFCSAKAKVTVPAVLVPQDCSSQNGHQCQLAWYLVASAPQFSVVDRQRFNAVPDPAVYFDTDPDPTLPTRPVNNWTFLSPHCIKTYMIETKTKFDHFIWIQYVYKKFAKLETNILIKKSDPDYQARIDRPSLMPIQIR